MFSRVHKTVYALKWTTIIGTSGIEGKRWRFKLARGRTVVLMIRLACSRTATGASRASSVFFALWLIGRRAGVFPMRNAMRSRLRSINHNAKNTEEALD